MTISIEWLEGILGSVAAIGIFLGLLSVTSPRRSIQLYQKIMQAFNWRVEPIRFEQELKNTRALGALILLASIAIFIALFRAKWFLYLPSLF